MVNVLSPALVFKRTYPSNRLLSTKYAVAILGAGNGGLALAAFLAQHGHRVALWNRSLAPVAAVARCGGITLTTANGSAQVSIPLATTDISDAVSDVPLLLVAVPACAHADIARACAPHLR